MGALARPPTAHSQPSEPTVRLRLGRSPRRGNGAQHLSKVCGLWHVASRSGAPLATSVLGRWTWDPEFRIPISLERLLGGLVFLNLSITAWSLSAQINTWIVLLFFGGISYHSCIGNLGLDYW